VRYPDSLRLLFVSAAIVSAIAGCSIQEEAEPKLQSQQSQLLPKYSDKQIRASIIDDASKLGIVDGFYYGEEARNFKTAYLLTTPETKTDFAMAYRDMLSGLNEDMLRDWKSYVAYSKRSAFARSWWSKRSDEFNKQSEKMKIVWIHEALMDAGELSFRAIEKLSAGTMDSPTVLTHDEEQKLVYKYAEDGQTFGSLSTQLR
jgi:hypothetical protein